MKKSENKVVASKVEETTVNTEMLNKLSAIAITEKLNEKNSVRSIFKKEFNNKKDRTACRTKLHNAIAMYLLHVAHNKVELAAEKLTLAKDIAKKYYVAEDKFTSVADYANANMEENKKEALKLFIETIAPAKDSK